MLDANTHLDKPQDYEHREFIGEVVVIDDVGQYQRIKAKIPDLWDEYSIEELPWCTPATVSEAGPTSLSIDIPEIGSYVLIKFQKGDTHYPIYSSGAHTNKSLKGSVLSINYPDRIGRVVNACKHTHSGIERERTAGEKQPAMHDLTAPHSWFIDRSSNEAEYKNPTLTRIGINSEGSVDLEARGGAIGGGFLSMSTDKDCLLTVGEYSGGSFIMDVATDTLIDTVQDTVINTGRNLEMSSTEETHITAKSVVITVGSTVINITHSSIDISSSKITLTSGDIVLDGKVQLLQDLRVEGKVTAGGTIKGEVSV